MDLLSSCMIGLLLGHFGWGTTATISTPSKLSSAEVSNDRVLWHEGERLQRHPFVLVRHCNSAATRSITGLHALVPAGGTAERSDTTDCPLAR